MKTRRIAFLPAAQSFVAMVATRVVSRGNLWGLTKAQWDNWHINTGFFSDGPGISHLFQLPPHDGLPEEQAPLIFIRE